jgi:hypothetical protein
VPLGRNHAEPRCTVRRGAGAAQLGRPVQRVAHGASAWRRRGSARRRRCSTRRRRHGADTRETAGNDGSPVRRRRRDTTATGERRVRWLGWHGGGPGDGTVGEAVGATAARTRRSGGGREARSGGRRRERGRLSGRAARCPDSGFKPRCRCGAWQQRGNGALPRGPGAARGV